MSSVCQCCNEDDEDPMHALIKCIDIQNIWRQAGVSHGNAQTFLEWWEDQGGILTKENLQLVAVICWEICSRRNQLIWNRKRIEDAQVLVSTKQGCTLNNAGRSMTGQPLKMIAYRNLPT